LPSDCTPGGFFVPDIQSWLRSRDEAKPKTFQLPYLGRKPQTLAKSIGAELQ
jgi:hypothetical protein